MSSLPPILRTPWARRAAVLLAVAVALRVALPPALEAGIAWGGERALGVPVSVSNVDLGLLRGRVVLDGLAVAGPGHPPGAEGGVDAATALLHWDRLDLNLEWLSLLRGRLHLSELQLAAPRARVELDETGAPILPEPTPSEEAPRAEEGAEAAEEGAEAAEEGAEAAEEEAAVEEAESGGGWPILVDRLELTAIDVRLLDGEATPALAAGLESLHLEAVSFDDAGLGLGAIGLQAPALRVRRDFVFERPPAEPAQADAPPSEPPPGAAAIHRMETLRIERAEFVMLTEAGPLHMAIQAEATGVTTAPAERFPVSLALEIEGGVFEVEGRAGVTPPAFDGQLRWRELPLPPLTMIARPDLGSWIESHRASGELEVDFRLEPEGDAPAGLTLSGHAVSEDLRVRDPESEDLSFGWKRLAVPIDSLSVPLGDAAATEPVRLALGAIELVAPRAVYAEPTTALERLFPAGEADAPEPQAPSEAGPEPVVSIASFGLREGEIQYRDASLRPGYRGRVRAIRATLRDVRLPEQTVGELSLQARLPVRSELSIRGTHAARTSDVHVTLEDLSLGPLTPFAVDAAGYAIDQGGLSLETSAARQGDRWDVSNDLVLHELGLSGTGNGRLEKLLGIPVDLAMALLRDLQGDIRLGIPVAFDRDGLAIGIGSVVRDALRAAIAGAATSPLKMMGAAFSFAEGGGLGVEPVRMEPAGTALAAGEEENLSVLVDLLEARPLLAVRLEGDATDADRDGLAERILIERLAADHGLPELEDAGFLARRRVRGALQARGEGKPGTLGAEDSALLARYRAATEVPPERFARLAQERANALARALRETHAVEPDQVRVADEAEPEGDESGVRIGFEARPSKATP